MVTKTDDYAYFQFCLFIAEKLPHRTVGPGMVGGETADAEKMLSHCDWKPGRARPQPQRRDQSSRFQWNSRYPSARCDFLATTLRVVSVTSVRKLRGFLFCYFVHRKILFVNLATTKSANSVIKKSFCNLKMCKFRIYDIYTYKSYIVHLQRSQHDFLIQIIQSIHLQIHHQQMLQIQYLWILQILFQQIIFLQIPHL